MLINNSDEIMVVYMFVYFLYRGVIHEYLFILSNLHITGLHLQIFPKYFVSIVTKDVFISCKIFLLVSCINKVILTS